MKTMKKIVLLAIFAAAFLLSTGTAYSAYYGVYDIRDDNEPEQYPLVEDFQWVDKTYTYQGSGGETFSVDFTLYAPKSWSTKTDPNGNSYSTYIDTNKSDNILYSYYYKVTSYTGTESLEGLTIPYSPADLSGYGSGGDSGESFSIGNNPFSEIFNIDFTYGGFDPGLDSGQTSKSFYMTSENWWGWQQLDYTINGTTNNATGSTLLSSNGVDYSPNGHLPAPNPEASTVALYIVGLIGMGTLYYRKKKMTEMEV